MASPVFLTAPLTLLPAVGALWYLLKRYEDYFEDARVFLALTLGLFGGLLATFLERQLFPFYADEFVAAAGAGGAFVLAVAGYAFFETVVKIAVLGNRRFRARKDAPFYGAALGLGMGAMMAFGFASLNVTVARGDYGTPYQPLPFASMAALSLGIVMVHGVSGVFAALHTGGGHLWKGLGWGTLVQIPLTFALWLFVPSVGLGHQFVPGPAVIAVLAGLVGLWWARDRILDRVVPQEIKDQLRRQQRREQRRASNEEE